MKTSNPDDAIDALVDSLDDYFFRIPAPETYPGSSWGGDNVDSERFQTAEFRSALDTFGDTVEKISNLVAAGICTDLDSQLWTCITTSWDYPLMLGFVFGLRLSGMSSEDTKRMAKTWKIGTPS